MEDNSVDVSPGSNLDSLRLNGYVVLRKLFPASQLQVVADMLGGPDGGSMRYDDVVQWVRGSMLPAIGASVGMPGLCFTKLRASDNNNSSDAASFHRDLVPISREVKGVEQMYTCLTYLDATRMEVVSGSHLKPAVSLVEALGRAGKDVVSLQLEPGDGLLFYSMLMHRGVFTERKPHRRVIQVFDVFPTPEHRTASLPKVLHLPSRMDPVFGKTAIFASKFSLGDACMNAFGYLNAATGYGSAATATLCSALFGPGRFLYASSEGAQKRLASVDPGAWQPLNLYVYEQGLERYDVPVEVAGEVYWSMFGRQYMLYGLVTLLVLVLVSTAVWTGVRKLF